MYIYIYISTAHSMPRSSIPLMFGRYKNEVPNSGQGALLSINVVLQGAFSLVLIENERKSAWSSSTSNPLTAVRLYVSSVFSFKSIAESSHHGISFTSTQVISTIAKAWRGAGSNPCQQPLCGWYSFPWLQNLIQYCELLFDLNMD